MRTFDFNTIAALMGRPGDILLAPADLGAFPHPLIKAGILVEAGRAETVSCPCGGGHPEVVERDIIRGMTRYSVYCAESGGLFDIPADSLRLWKISVAAILKKLQSQFDCPAEPGERISGLWYLGESQRVAAGFRRQIFFAERMNPAVEKELPAGSTQLLIIGEASPPPVEKFKDRVFQMHELLRVEDGEIVFDMPLIEARLAGKAPEPKKTVMPKKGPRAAREDMIKEILREHVKGARDAYWTSVKRGDTAKLLPRPTAQQLADQLKARTGKAVNQSTVNRTIADSTDKELKILWNGCNDENFVCNYGRKRKSSPRPKSDAEDDAAFMEEMFNQSNTEPPGDGFHVV